MVDKREEKKGEKRMSAVSQKEVIDIGAAAAPSGAVAAVVAAF